MIRKYCTLAVVFKLQNTITVLHCNRGDKIMVMSKEWMNINDAQTDMDYIRCEKVLNIQVVQNNRATLHFTEYL